MRYWKIIQDEKYLASCEKDELSFILTVLIVDYKLILILTFIKYIIKMLLECSI